MNGWGHEEVRGFPGVQGTLNAVLDTEIVYIDGACGMFLLGVLIYLKESPNALVSLQTA